jgi:hypothetical protein
MKKTYITPELEVVKIAVSHMLAASPDISTGSTPTSPGDSDAPGLGDDFDW